MYDLSSAYESLFPPPMNNSVCPHFFDGKNICLRETGVPLYHTDSPSLFPWLSDSNMALAAPVVVYWLLSLFFHGLDTSGWRWLEKYRIHESAEVQSRNRVTRTQVVLAVIVQQILQTVLGYVWMEETSSHAAVDHRQSMLDISQKLVPIFHAVLGRKIGDAVLDDRGSNIVYFVYWWSIPAIQFFCAM